MVTYTVSQIEALTGITQHMLRIWERRYDFVKAKRTSTNIRYYTDDELKTLINTGILLRNKYRISKIAAMDKEEIHARVAAILDKPATDIREDINALTLCMIEMDEKKFDEFYDSHLERNGLFKTFVDLIYPFLNHVGVLWGSNKAMPAQEHFISSLIRQKLITAIDGLPYAPENAPKLMLFLLNGEDHEIGLLFANYIARELGWKTYYLGPKVPADNIEPVNSVLNPDLMFTMMVSPRTPKFQPMFAKLLGKLKVPLIYSGNPNLLDTKIVKKPPHYIGTPEEFISYLKNFR